MKEKIDHIKSIVDRIESHSVGTDSLKVELHYQLDTLLEHLQKQCAHTKRVYDAFTETSTCVKCDKVFISIEPF